MREVARRVASDRAGWPRANPGLRIPGVRLCGSPIIQAQPINSAAADSLTCQRPYPMACLTVTDADQSAPRSSATRCRTGGSPMNMPVTTLDQRYSDPDAVAVGFDETCKVLETAELFWISTVRADGRPHVTPVVAVWAGGAICFSTGAGEQKFANLLLREVVGYSTAEISSQPAWHLSASSEQRASAGPNGCPRPVAGPKPAGHSPVTRRPAHQGNCRAVRRRHRASRR
jgi:Pyridoxamine 5'-phosphate oxidase